jgi:tRNA pseudouridine-54 N-methylase
MKKVSFATVVTLASSIGWAAPPDENLVESCLQAQSVASCITIRNINVDEVFQEDGYADGFNASYILKYNGADIGYAEKKSDQALISFHRF